MSASRVTKESLKAMAEMQGLDIADGVLEELVPLVRRTAEASKRLDDLDLERAEPASVFVPAGE